MNKILKGGNIMNSNNICRFYAISGHMLSGKDTLARTMADYFTNKGFNPIILGFADALKIEVDLIINLIRRDGGDMAKIMADSFYHDVSASQIARMVRILTSDALSDPSLTAKSRTQSVREALQYWGTNVRRGADPDYWVKKVRQRVYELLDADNKNVIIISDARFPNELDMVKSLCGKIIRLNVSPVTQVRRLYKRDGLQADQKKLSHPSETACDDYNGFDYVIDTTTIPLNMMLKTLENQGFKA